MLRLPYFQPPKQILLHSFCYTKQNRGFNSFIKLFFLLVISLQSFAQEDLTNQYTRADRKGNLYFSVGADYKITPIYSSGGGFGPEYIDVGKHNSGTAFNYNLDYFIVDKLSIGFSHSMRYDMVLMSEELDISTRTGAKTVSKGLIYGYHWYLDYHFLNLTASELFLRLGKSSLNGGTEYTGKTERGSEYSSFHFFSWNFALGYKKERFSMMVGAYTSDVTEYEDINSIVIPYLSFRYNLGRLKTNAKN